MNWAQFAVQWLHVLLGIVWFGYAISIYFLVSPALAELPESPAPGDHDLAAGPDRRCGCFPIVSILVILLGIVRGTVFGRIDSFDGPDDDLRDHLVVVACSARSPSSSTGPATSVHSSRASRTRRTTPPRSRGCASYQPVDLGTVHRRLHLHDPHALPVSGYR